MDKVKKLIAAGASISGAITESLGMSIAAFADKHERNATVMSSILSGSRAPSEADVEALVAELGGTPAEWRHLLWLAGKPAESVA